MTKLFLGNIPYSFNEKQIADWVESFRFPVESVEIIRDQSTGKPRGFGFVRLKDGQQEPEVIRCLNGQLMGGRVMTVSLVVPLDDGRGRTGTYSRSS
jgi:RNA recognition motif-containing protein